MAPKARLALDPVQDLRRRLARRNSMALATCVAQWWREQALGEHPAAVGKRIAFALVEQRPADAKHAGIVLLHERLADHLGAADLPACAALFASGAIADGTICDSFAIKVLGTMLHRVRGRGDIARELASWRSAASMWQRRAACVAFTALAPQGDAALTDLTQLIFLVCATVVWSPERLDQTAVGWLLRELSRGEPTRVEGFVRRHARFMSRECVRQAIEKLPATRQKELVAHWKRATRISRA